MRARRLKAIAAWINENAPELRAEIRRGYCSTDRKLPGTRLIHRGKGREGTRLQVYWRKDTDTFPRTLYDHNAAETYRSNDEVERWLERYMRLCHTGKHDFGGSVCDTCRIVKMTKRQARCRHSDPDNSGMCIKCGAVLDPD